MEMHTALELLARAEALLADHETSAESELRADIEAALFAAGRSTTVRTVQA